MIIWLKLHWVHFIWMSVGTLIGFMIAGLLANRHLEDMARALHEARTAARIRRDYDRPS